MEEKWAIQEQVFASTYQSSAAVLYIEVSCGELKLSDPGLLKRVLIERKMVYSLLHYISSTSLDESPGLRIPH